jgi:hypothetical protein
MEFKDKFDPYAGHGFTRDQINAIEKIKKWVDDPKRPVFTLSGAAGTGKTYLLKYLLNKVITHTVCVTAPTHKAVKVVEESTGRKGRTLQALHGLRPNTSLDTFDINRVQFDPLGEEKIKNYKFVVIDEASQIPLGLHRLNVARAKQYSTKILYVGDINQLSPINERVSEVFVTEDENKAMLHEVVRQAKSNPLLELLELSKYDIANDTSTLLTFISKNKGKVNDAGEGYVVLGREAFSSKLVEYFNDDRFSRDVKFVRYGAWTNSNILKWNLYIRNSIIQHNNKLIHVDDLITAYRSIINEFGSAVITNSDDYFIDSITERYGDDGFRTYVVTLRSLTSGISTMANIVDYLDPSFNRFRTKISQIYNDAKYAKPKDRGRMWRRYYDFKDRNLVTIDIPLNIGGELVTTIPKDIDYGYGLTIHKLQGSTIENMFINMIDICYYNGIRTRPVQNNPKSPDAIEMRNKLIYTALSRASKKVILLW